MSPRHHSWRTPRRSSAASTAVSASLLPWMPAITPKSAISSSSVGPAEYHVPRAIEPVEPRADAVAAGGRLGFGGGVVVGQAQELDGPGAGVEDRALGELVPALALRIHRAGIDEVELFPAEMDPAGRK